MASTVLAALPPRVTATDAAPPARVAAGLLRLALDRAQALSRADAGGEQISTRRRGGKIVLLAADPGAARPGGGARPRRRRPGRAGPVRRRPAGARRTRRAAAAGRLGPGRGRASCRLGLGDGRLLPLAAALGGDAVSFLLRGRTSRTTRSAPRLNDVLALSLKGSLRDEVADGVREARIGSGEPGGMGCRRRRSAPGWTSNSLRPGWACSTTTREGWRPLADPRCRTKGLASRQGTIHVPRARSW